MALNPTQHSELIQESDTDTRNGRAENENLIPGEKELLQNENAQQAEIIRMNKNGAHEIGYLSDSTNEQSTDITVKTAAEEVVETPVFTCFLRLPPELQDRVWEFATESRIMVVQGSDSGGPYEIWGGKNLPVISQICKRSRALFLRECFLLHTELGDSSEEFPIYFNPTVDTLFIKTREYWDGFREDGFFENVGRFLLEVIERCNVGRKQKWKGFRSMALPLKVANTILRNKPHKFSFFNDFPALEEVVFLVGDDDCAGDWPDYESNTILHAFDKEGRNMWEFAMQELGYFLRSESCEPTAGGSFRPKTENSRPNEGYEKFLGLKVTAAILGPLIVGMKPVKDTREGLSLMGPPNAVDAWPEYFF